MEKILKQILKKLEILEILEKKVDRLEPLVEESHQWIRILVEPEILKKAQ